MSNSLNREKFLKIFSSQFEENFRKNISLNTAFKQIESWSSLQALIITVAIHDEWGISYSDEDFRDAKTVKDLFEITKIKTAEI